MYAAHSAALRPCARSNERQGESVHVSTASRLRQGNGGSVHGPAVWPMLTDLNQEAKGVTRGVPEHGAEKLLLWRRARRHEATSLYV